MKDKIVDYIVSCSSDGRATELTATRLAFFAAQEAGYILDPTELNSIVDEALSRVYNTINLANTVMRVKDLKLRLEKLPDHMPVVMEAPNKEWIGHEFLWEDGHYLSYVPLWYASVSFDRDGREAFILGCHY